MATLRINKFNGMLPAASDWGMDISQAMSAHNALTRDGALRSYRAPAVVTGAAYTIYGLYLPPYMEGTNPQALTFDHWVSTTEAVDPGYENGFNHFILWHHDGVTPPEWYEVATNTRDPLIVPAPERPLRVTKDVAASTAAAAAIVSTGGSAANNTPDERGYTYTWVDKFSVESPPAPCTYVSNTLTTDIFTLDQFDTAPANAVACRVYRTSAVLTHSKAQNNRADVTFQVLNEFSLPITTVRDDKLLKDIVWGTLMTSDNLPPPPGLQKVETTSTGHFVAFRDNQIWISERNQPWNFPEKLRFELPDRIIGMAVHEFTTMGFGEARSQTVVFFGTTGHPYRMTIGMSTSGARDETIADVTPYMENLPCLSPLSMVAGEQGAVYASRQGLVLLTPTGEAHLVTKTRIDEDKWQEWIPNLAAWHRGRYYATKAPNGPGIVVDITAKDKQPEVAGFSTLELPATALHSGSDGRLYYASNGIVSTWNDGVGDMPFKWRSKVVHVGAATSFSAGRVHGQFTAITLRLISNGVTRFTRKVTSEAPFRIPTLTRSTDWQVEVEGAGIIHEICLANSFAELIDRKDAA